MAHGWCRGTDAIDKSGVAAQPWSEDAVAWCASGALEAAQAGASDLEYRRALLRLQDATGDELIAAFNDRQQTVEPILAVFDRAIATGIR